MRRWMLSVLLVGLLVVVAAGCGGGEGGSAEGNDAGEGEAQRTKVRIGVPLHDVWPVYVAESEGYFDEVGLDVEISDFNSGAPLLAGLKSDSLDVVVTGLATIAALRQGVPLEIFMWEFDNATTGGLNVDPNLGITSIQDLAKAKSIAAFPNTCSQVSAVIAAEQAGLDYQQLPTRDVEPSLQGAALKRGDIDAGFTWSPHSFVNDADGFPLVVRGIEFGDVCPSSWSARPDFLSENPDVATKMVEARELALEAVKNDPQLAIDTLVSKLQVNREIAERTLEDGEWPTAEEQLDPNNRYSLRTKKGMAGQLAKADESLFEAGAIPESLGYETFADAVNPEYVQQYVEDQGN